jgi:hypothetical protein
MKRILILLVCLIILCYTFVPDEVKEEHIKFLYTVPSLIIPTNERTSFRIGTITLITETTKPTLIDIIEEKITDTPYKPHQSVVKKLEGTNNVPINDPDDWSYPQTNSLPMAVASLPGTYANPYYLPRPMPTPKPASAGGFR